METITLSEPAMDLLKRNVSGPQILVDDGNREAYRELVRGAHVSHDYICSWR